MCYHIQQGIKLFPFNLSICPQTLATISWLLAPSPSSSMVVDSVKRRLLLSHQTSQKAMGERREEESTDQWCQIQWKLLRNRNEKSFFNLSGVNGNSCRASLSVSQSRPTLRPSRGLSSGLTESFWGKNGFLRAPEKSLWVS